MRDDLYIAAKITVPAAHRDEFLALAKDLVEASRNEAGNNFYTLTESAEANVFYMLEHWKSQAAIDEHNATPHFAKLTAVVPTWSLGVGIEVLKPVI